MNRKESIENITWTFERKYGYIVRQTKTLFVFFAKTERKRKMKQKIVSVGTIFLGALLAIGPQTLFQPCPVTEKVMKCHWSAQSLIAVGVILVALGLAQLLVKNDSCLKVLCFVGIVVFASGLLLVNLLIGGCANAEMACNMKTFPIVNGLSAVGILLQLGGIVRKGNK